MPFKKGDKNLPGNRFGKGESGNPNGRPRKLPNLEKLLASVLGQEDKDGITKAEKILNTLSEQAEKGNVRASEIMLDRAWGKPKQYVENVNTNVNADMTEEQLNQRIALLLKKSEEDDTDQGTD